MSSQLIYDRPAQDRKEEDVIVSFFETVPHVLPPSVPDVPDLSGQEPTIGSLVDRQQFWIRLANTPERRETANVLIDRMYAWRGYDRNSLGNENPQRVTLIAYGMDNQAIGTITVGMDSPDGLLADENYHAEVDSLRARGRTICEFNGLAIDSCVKSKRVIASLFHIAMLYPWGMFGYTDAVIEVTPQENRSVHLSVRQEKIARAGNLSGGRGGFGISGKRDPLLVVSPENQGGRFRLELESQFRDAKPEPGQDSSGFDKSVG